MMHTRGGAMTRVILDIETVPIDWEEFDSEEQEYLLKHAKTEEERQEVVEKLGLSPFTGRVVAIAMLNPDSGRGVVLAEGLPGEGSAWAHEGDNEFWTGNEAEILERFWDLVKRYDQVISFNGRAFDAPFLITRSLILSVPISRNLLSNRYRTKEHFDLCDALSFFGLTRRYSLDFISRRLGVGPAKAGMAGHEVAQAYREGRMEEIAQYCLRDVEATAKLLDRVQTLIGPVFE
jgi:DNA polymerase elongation subunit (family B)